MPGVDSCVFAHVCRNTDSAVWENISTLGGLMLLKKTLKNCAKEYSMYYLKAEKINSNNICYIWKTRPKLQIILRNICFSISNGNFLIPFVSLRYILIIKSCGNDLDNLYFWSHDLFWARAYWLRAPCRREEQTGWPNRHLFASWNRI